MTEISFDEIPLNWRKPGVYTEVKPVYDDMGLAEYPARTIIIGQKLASGSAAPEVITAITRPEQGLALAGAGSVGAEMVDYFKRANRATECMLILLPDAAAGIAASGTLTFTGAPAFGGPLPVYVEDERLAIAVTAGQSLAAIAIAVAAAINAMAHLPVTASAAEGVVTLTARHKGEVGNGYHIAVARRQGDAVPAGLSVAVSSMSGGATNPDIDDALDAIGNEWFTDLVVPWTDATTLSKLSAWLDERYSAMARLDAHAYAGVRGNYAGLVTKGGLTNSRHLTLIGAHGSPSAPHKWAASLAGVASHYLTNDPARQLRSLVLVGIEAPAAPDCFEEGEQNLLLGKGISTFSRLKDGRVTLDRVITAYRVSNLGVADTAWLDIMVPKTLSRIRYDWGAYAQLQWPRHKLANDGTAAANHADNVATPRRVHGSWGARCDLYERRGWIEDAETTVGKSVFARDDSDKNRLNSRKRVQIIGNLMVLAGALEFQV
ncbi:phage tail sheath subtilisin-like domain-containing protein [Pararhodobacter sp.]|uniref:phage tail sheath subtilisin-like domain-containing protein n=1 Tax=Pararhodobacter sp. TaxID=2127056 RepID=UPI002AFE20E6|nr:phage tail sheath subtilisin-like domain-containing protein [Pararhodobacter sp.]